MLNGQKAQGADKASDVIKNTYGLYDKIYTEVKNMLGLSIN